MAPRRFPVVRGTLLWPDDGTFCWRCWGCRTTYDGTTAPRIVVGGLLCPHCWGKPSPWWRCFHCDARVADCPCYRPRGSAADADMEQAKAARGARA